MPDITRDAVLGRAGGGPRRRASGDIVSLGMVSGVVVRGTNIGFSIEVARARAALEPLRKSAENAVKAIPGVTSVTAVLTAERTAERGTIRSADGSLRTTFF